MLENVKVKPEMEHYVAWQQWPAFVVVEAYRDGKEKYGK